MGEIREDLYRGQLPDREPHNGRMFVDLCENIHIHFRELRIVFSLDEFFEFCDIVGFSRNDARNYLAQNPDYAEGKYPDMVMVAGGNDRQFALLQNSPEPNQSTYMANEFAIELQTERIIDEIHVHWRDYRLAIPRDHFKQIADAFHQSKLKLEQFESDNDYERLPHAHRKLRKPEHEDEHYRNEFRGIKGAVDLPLTDIRSTVPGLVLENDAPAKTGEDYSKVREWKGDVEWVKRIVLDLKAGKATFPILVSTETNGDHLVIDGHHRFCSAHIAGKKTISAVVLPVTFEESAPFRKVESMLKQFDKDTNGVMETSGFCKEWLAYKLNRHYANHYRKLIRKKVMRRYFYSPIRKPYQAVRQFARRMLGRA